MTVGTNPDRIEGDKRPGFISRVSPVQVRPPLVTSDSVTVCHSPAEDYHRWSEVSCSQLKALAASPLEFYSRHVAGSAPAKRGQSLEYGTLLHLWAEIGEETFWSRVACPSDDLLTPTGQVGKAAKAWIAEQPEGAIIVSPADRAQLWNQTRQILANKAAARLLDESVDREFNVRFRWNGHDCRSRIDGATASKFYDLKTTSEADPQKTAMLAMRKWHYDLQSAMYGEAAIQCGWEPHSMRFIFTSNVWPHLCAVVYLPADLQERGRRKCLALLAELKQRREWDSWLPSGYGEEHELEVPHYMREGN